MPGFPAAILNDALNTGKYDRGVVVAESFDYEIVDKVYDPYDNMSVLVSLKSTGEIDKKVIASVTETLRADYPYEFIGAVINRRLPNPFMPDAPQRIAMDTSAKLAVRFGETLKKYEARGLDKSNLVLIPLALAGYARYLRGINDEGVEFAPSPDPMLEELQAIVAGLEVNEGEQDFSCLKSLYSRKDVFGVDLYELGLGETIEGMVKELYAGTGAVRKTLHKYVSAR